MVLPKCTNPYIMYDAVSAEGSSDRGTRVLEGNKRNFPALVIHLELEKFSVDSSLEKTMRIGDFKFKFRGRMVQLKKIHSNTHQTQ